MSFAIPDDVIAAENARHEQALAEDYEALGRQLARRGISIAAMTERAMGFAVAVPTWGVGTGGTRFARFPGPGEPRHIHDKLEDCGVINQLTRATPNVSPHFPWDKVTDYNALRQEAASHALGFDAVNSNTFQDQKAQRHSYKFGSLTHAGTATQMQAV
jgi:L-rhamnose isomerase/sugar isomerase